MTEPVKKSSPVLIAAMWFIVMVPLAWGVYQSVVKSMPLFQASSAAPSNPAAK